MLFQQLSQSPVFRGISPDEMENLLIDSQYQIKKFSKGDMLAFREDKCENLMIVLKGSVKGEMLDPSGKSIKIEDIMAPYPIASAFLFGQRNQFPVNVTANEEVEVFYLSKNSVIEMFQKNKVFLTNYLNSISNRSQFLANKLMFLNFKTIKGKLANYLLKLAAPDKTEITLPKSQAEMAQFFGVTRPSFARSLKEMEQEGLIETNRREIKILNKQQLIRLLQQ
ncbi:helix-turn-helix domain-containing protein [Labilibaculum sp. A4]|uniref:Helix-turn-helix domain-containing protein n=1 Tax=Labilibaculum euxinus TaxID=2686357 RepID=A0A425YB15_9BACT|nr:Crp/Fnr family transcriptional regulator [Labilibaculum euxinus]MDQ1771120.1 Crp/Fnr family transcriptional regulator [Labilibaculum euxinus]MUP39055.1 helix-turn-helix domain-containing protein [Labilibaculum euxinus]MVB08260.1 helix-turn-helix domain-containing protein [Labilibaculum euxinus]MWN76873.1 helix-turn-helix domain-containing protein [Labilibaculum euxinus]